jgi:non-heme chloroperoxidase
MLFFVHHGHRVVGIDRRGHGRSSQVSDGHDMDHYVADAAAVVEHLDLRDAIHIGHSTGGGEVARYVARHGKGRVAKAVLMAAVPPMMVKTPSNPGGLPIEVFDGLRKSLAANRAQFYRDLAAGPFYGFNRPGAKPLEGVIANSWRQGMMGGAKAHYDGIKAFSETDFTEDLKTHARHAGGRRPDRSAQKCFSALGQAPQEQHVEDLPRFPARLAHYQRRCD